MNASPTSSAPPATNSGTIVGLTLHYRDAAMTERCLRSLLKEGLRHVLIWDNSEDGGQSSEILMSTFAEECRVSLVVSKINLGFAMGANSGVQWLAQRFPGAPVLLINNDAWLMPGAVRVLTEALDVSGAKLVYPRIDQARIETGTNYYHRWLGILTTSKWPGSFAYANGCCLLLAADASQNPWFDEDFFMYGEDTFLGWRYRRFTHQMIGVEKALVKHEGSASSGLGSMFYESRIVAAHLILARKTASTRLEWLCMLAGRACTLPARAVMRTIRYRSLVPIRGLLEGARLSCGRDPMLEKARSQAICEEHDATTADSISD